MDVSPFSTFEDMKFPACALFSFDVKVEVERDAPDVANFGAGEVGDRAITVHKHPIFA